MNLHRLISILSAAPLFALYLYLYLIIFVKSFVSPLIFLAYFFLGLIFLTILPILPILIDYKKGKVDLFVFERKKRPKYFSWAIASYLIGATIFYLLNDAKLFIFLMCYATVTTSIALLTYISKVSVHTSGIAGPLTYMVMIDNPLWIISYILVIIVGYSRIKERAHSFMETILGAIDSILVTYITVTISTYLL